MFSAIKAILGALTIAIMSLFGVAHTQPTTVPTTTSASPASLTITAPSGGIVDVGQVQHITWIPQNYAAHTVSVDIIRKVSDNPSRYEVVRTIASSTINDGDATWVPAVSDAGTDTFAEVGCTLTVQACTGSVSPQALAVVNTGAYANTASAYKAIEQMYNK